MYQKFHLLLNDIAVVAVEGEGSCLGGPRMHRTLFRFSELHYTTVISSTKILANRNMSIKVVQIRRTWYFFSHEERQGQKGGIQKDLNCVWAYPKTQNSRKSEGSWVTCFTYIQLARGEYPIHQVLSNEQCTKRCLSTLRQAHMRKDTMLSPCIRVPKQHLISKIFLRNMLTDPLAGAC